METETRVDAPLDIHAALIELHRGLVRLGPGDDGVTRQLLARLPPLPPHPRIADIGCGAGAGALLLAEWFRAPVTAVDATRVFLDVLDSLAPDRGVADLVCTVEADMGSLGWTDASLDLLWSEGAAYNLTFAGACRTWRPLLAPGGLAVISELSWFSDDRPAEVRQDWDAEYPHGLVADGQAVPAVQELPAVQHGAACHDGRWGRLLRYVLFPWWIRTGPSLAQAGGIMRPVAAQSPMPLAGTTERVDRFPQPPPSEAPLILVVDDDQHGREGLVEFLVVCGYRVIQAADGAEALVKVKLRRPAVVLLDLALPRIDGWRVAQTIRRELALPGTRLVALSGLDYPNELARALECGCDIVLPKPCDPARLLDTIRMATSAPPHDI